MIYKILAILLFLFIFGITLHSYADPFKSINNRVNQETIIKMNANKITLQKKRGMLKDSIQSSEKHQSEFRPDLSHKDRWWASNEAKLNFLKILEEKRKAQSPNYLEKIHYADGYLTEGWGEKILRVMYVAEAKSFTSDGAPPRRPSYPPENKYFEERKILETFKLLHFKREELYKEIFMGFRFYFKPLSGHLFLEWNANPSFENGSALIIPF